MACHEEGTYLPPQAQAQEDHAGSNEIPQQVQAQQAQPAAAAVEGAEAALQDVETNQAGTEEILLRRHFGEEDWAAPEVPPTWLLRPEFVLPCLVGQACRHLPAWFDPGLADALTLGLGSFPAAGSAFIAGVATAMVLWMSRRGAIGLIVSSLVFQFGTDYLVGTGAVGLLLGQIVYCVIGCCRSCSGRLSRRQVNYALVISAWLVLVQLLTYLVMRLLVPVAAKIASPFAASMILPLTSCAYALVAMASLDFLNYRFLTTAVPARAMIGLRYMCAANATAMKYAGFLPKVHVEDWSAVTVGMGLAGASISTMICDIIGRTLLVERLRVRLMSKSGTPKQAPISAGQDTRLCSPFSFQRVMAVYTLLILLCLVPGGATWMRIPWVWMTPVVVFITELLPDVLIMQLHRTYYPVPNESWLGTYLRLSRPLQNWPSFQSDGGRAYRALVAAAEGEAAPEPESVHVDPVVRAALQVQWSRHPYFTDIRLVAMLAIFGANQFLSAALLAVYGKCRTVFPAGYDMGDGELCM